MRTCPANAETAVDEIPTQPPPPNEDERCGVFYIHISRLHAQNVTERERAPHTRAQPALLAAASAHEQKQLQVFRARARETSICRRGNGSGVGGRVAAGSRLCMCVLRLQCVSATTAHVRPTALSRKTQPTECKGHVWDRHGPGRKNPRAGGLVLPCLAADRHRHQARPKRKKKGKKINRGRCLD